MTSATTFRHGERVIQCAGETLILHTQRAIYRPATRTLLVADVHLGKESVFGRAGIAMPYEIGASNLLRLSRLLTYYAAEQLIVLGDFMHAAPHHEDTWPQEFTQWLERYPSLKIAVIAGNHDRMDCYDQVDSRVQWFKEPHIAPPFAYAHQPRAYGSHYTLAGHLHPTFLLSARSDRIRSPVFWFRSSMAILPAFGTFTGGGNIMRRASDRVFLVGPNDIIEIPPLGNEFTGAD